MKGVRVLAHSERLKKTLEEQYANSAVPSRLLVVEPFLLQDTLLEVSSLWRTYGDHEEEGIEVVSVSYSNVLLQGDYDLMDLPAEIKRQSNHEETTPCSIHQKIIRLTDKLRFFSDGHGNQSLLKSVTALMSRIDTLQFLLSDGETWEDALGQLGKKTLHELSDEVGKGFISMWGFIEISPFKTLFEGIMWETGMFPEEESELTSFIDKGLKLSKALRGLNFFLTQKLSRSKVS